MEYHNDRFEDHSFIFYKKQKPIALFPANKKGNTLYSHQGLTFGSFVLSKNIGANEVNELLELLINHATKEGFQEIVIKMIPQIYHKQASNELSYFLHLKNGQLVNKNFVLAIDYSQPLQIHKTKRKHYEKNKDIGFEVEITSNFESFWTGVLQPKLQQKYNANPVHTLEEITKLQQHFPENIIQYNLKLDGEIVAGITIFKNKEVVKSQYGATTAKGEAVRALEFLFLHIIYKFQEEGIRYFSMGTVDADTDKGYNVGLLKQKEELGCVAFTQDIYKLSLS